MPYYTISITSFIRLVLVLSMIIGPICCFFMYFKSKISLITIQYAGGEIGFDKKWFSEQEMEQFQKLLRLAKDKVIDESENAVANKLQDVISTFAAQTNEKNSYSKIDEITKLGDLLSKGLITQEEFENMKKGLM